MIYNTFELHQEGSLPGAHLVTYIQEYSEAMAINDRPLILLCSVSTREAAIQEPPTERRSPWH